MLRQFSIGADRDVFYEVFGNSTVDSDSPLSPFSKPSDELTDRMRCDAATMTARSSLTERFAAFERFSLGFVNHVHRRSTTFILVSDPDAPTKLKTICRPLSLAIALPRTASRWRNEEARRLIEVA